MESAYATSGLEGAFPLLITMFQIEVEMMVLSKNA